MNVASLELCKELYELSGWAGDRACYFNSSVGWILELDMDGLEQALNKEAGDWLPAYALGYLLRKLQMVELDFRNAEGLYPVRLDFRPNKGWYCGLIQTTTVSGQYADIPEDAAAKLAIELLKSGVLKK